MALSRREFVRTGAIAGVAATAAGTVVLDGCSTAQWLTTIQTDLPILVQIAESIAGIIASAQGKGQVDATTAAMISSISNEVATDLQTIQALVASYQTAVASAKPGILGQIEAGLVAVQGNLQAVLNSLHLTNTSIASTITTSIGLAITTVLAIMALMPPAPPQPAPAGIKATMPVARVNIKATSTKPEAVLKAVFNELVEENGYGQFAIK